MPMYMDVHEVPGATAEDVARAHSMDMEIQARYGVNDHHYWFNESLDQHEPKGFDRPQQIFRIA